MWSRGCILRFLENVIFVTHQNSAVEKLQSAQRYMVSRVRPRGEWVTIEFCQTNWYKGEIRDQQAGPAQPGHSGADGGDSLHVPVPDGQATMHRLEVEEGEYCYKSVNIVTLAGLTH